MAEQFARFISVLLEIKDRCLKGCIVVFGIMIAVAYPLTFLVQRIMAKLAGTGWAGLPPWRLWSDNLFGEIIEGGIPVIAKNGESTVFFKAMNSGIQVFLTLTIQILLVGFASWVIIKLLRNKDSLSKAITSSVKPSMRFLGAMWLTLSPILFAGLIGTFVQIYVVTPDFINNNTSFVPWSIVASVTVIFLVFVFLRITFLSYIRLESSERLFDSIKYSIHISSGKVILIMLVIAPVILLSMTITYFTNYATSNQFIRTVASQLGILLVVIVETALFISLTDKQKKPGDEIKKELLG